MNEIIKTLLSTLGHPVEYMDYDGGKTSYFVFNYADDRGDNFADDTPQVNVYSVQIHFFCPKSFDYTSFKIQVRDLLFNNGFSYPAVEHNYESDTKINHLVFVCDYALTKEV